MAPGAACRAEFWSVFGLATGSEHTSGLRAGGSEWFADDWPLRRVSEDLPAERSSQYLFEEPNYFPSTS